MRQRSRRFVSASRALFAALLAGVSLGVCEASELEFWAPFAQAQASDFPQDRSAPQVDWTMDAAWFPYELGLYTPKRAFAAVGAAAAQAAASLDRAGPNGRFGLVSARSSGRNSGAFAQAMMAVEIRDPQQRAEVLVDFEFKAAANVQVKGTASWSWRLDAATFTDGSVTLDGGKILRLVPPESGPSKPVFPIIGGRGRVVRNADEDPGLAEFEGFFRGRSVGIRQQRQDTARTTDSGPLWLRTGFYVVDIIT